MSTIANPGQDSYRRGALSLMDKHADAIRPAYALTPDERTLMLARGDLKMPEPLPPPKPKKVGNTPEARAAFAAWLAVPVADRYRGMLSNLARKHGAEVSCVFTLLRRWKKDNQYKV